MSEKLVVPFESASKAEVGDDYKRYTCSRDHNFFMAGAAAMAGIAALRAGAGLVTVACPAVASYSPELMTEPIQRAHELAAKLTLTAIGPGIGTADETREMVRTLYTTLEKPMVVDADESNPPENVSTEEVALLGNG